MSAPAEVRHNEAAQRFEVAAGSGMATCHYHRSGPLLTLHHTEVPHDQRGKGVAAVLVETALAYARENQLKVVPACSYVRSYMRRHPRTQDLMA